MHGATIKTTVAVVFKRHNIITHNFIKITSPLTHICDDTLIHIKDFSYTAYIAYNADIQTSGFQSVVERQRKNLIDLFFTYPKRRGTIIKFSLIKAIQTTKIQGEDVWQ
jgi:hypothetical protein